MKKFNIFLLLLILLLNFNTSLNALCKLKQKITYSNKGSKSEAKNGYLLYKKTTIPDVFQKIICGDTVYVFFTRKNAWDDSGYFKTNDDAILEASEEEITKSKIEDGYYLGNKKLLKTPSNWIYVEWENNSAYVSIDKINDLIKKFNIKKIERDKFNEILKGKIESTGEIIID